MFLINEVLKGYALNVSGSCCGPLMGFCEHGNEASGSIQGGEFVDEFRDC
jgi:hypothetical protein